jgi:hypothetical protein
MTTTSISNSTKVTKAIERIRDEEQKRRTRNFSNLDLTDSITKRGFDW